MNIKAVLSKVDAGDAKFLVGLGLVAYGVSLVSVPWAFIAIGAILMADSYSGVILRALAAFRPIGGKSK